VRLSAPPLVWVVTPVFNGERYLRECIESVLGQTYTHWRFAAVDNRSTDSTPAIVREYAAADSRISLHRQSLFLPTLANWNRALRLLPADAAYCKVVHADDTLLPECLERMVSVAETHSSVGLVTSYAIWGDEVRHDGYVPFPVDVIDGREICRATLERRCYVFGSPTSLLLRADLIRQRRSFYREDNIHGDTEACFDMLRSTDLGFVHQVLTRTRIHDDALTSFSSRVNTFDSGWLAIVHRHGPRYLDRRAYARRWTSAVVRYLFFLLRATLRGKLLDPDFRAHHRSTVIFLLRTIGRTRPGAVASGRDGHHA
jgi:glycosyltransferase involved in cell wall biosynthesis